MKKNIIFFISLLLTITTSYLFSYTFSFGNCTTKTLVLTIKKRAGIQERYYQIVAPGETAKQQWADANCLESVQWAELNPQLPKRGGLDFVNQSGDIQDQKGFDATFFNKTTGKGLYLWNNLKIVLVPNDLFKQTREAATKLVKGFDSMACQIIDALTLEVKDKAFAALNLQLTTFETQLNQFMKDKTRVTNPETQANLDRIIAELTIKIANKKNEVTAYLKKTVEAATNKETCFIRLGKLADAAGKISGITICSNRDFIIFETGYTDPLTSMPLLIAETWEG